MPLPCPGPAPISLLDIQNEFGGTYLDGTYTRINEYYRGGPYVVNNSTNARIPTSGQISFADFFCGDGEIVVTIGSGTNVKVSSLFGTYWSRINSKRLIISQGAVIGGTGSNPALDVDNNNRRVGMLTIENKGSIIGFGGAAGVSGAGGNGGNAINVSSTTQGIIIKNTGSILAGGGGGGRGGTNSSTLYVSLGGNPFAVYDWTINFNGGSGGKGEGYLQNKTLGQEQYKTGNLNVTIAGEGFTGGIGPGFSFNLNHSGGRTINVEFSSGSSGNINSSGGANMNIYLSSNSFVNINTSGGGTINIIGPGRATVNSSGGTIVNRSTGNPPYNRTDTSTYYIALNQRVDAPGNLGPSVKGGDGGSYGNSGSAGQNGSVTSGSGPGSSGYSINGISNVSSLQNSGTITGPTI